MYVQVVREQMLLSAIITAICAQKLITALVFKKIDTIFAQKC
jgi:hypothetical protein